MSNRGTFLKSLLVWDEYQFNDVSIFQCDDGLYYIIGDDPHREGPFATEEEIVNDIKTATDNYYNHNTEYDEFYDPETDSWPNG